MVDQPCRTTVLRPSYSRNELLSFATPELTGRLVKHQLWSTLCQFGICVRGPTPRACRSGARKQRFIGVVTRMQCRQAYPVSGINRSNLVSVPVSRTLVWNFPTILNTNIHGCLAEKLDEIHTVCMQDTVDVACITETWCHKDIPDSSVNMPGYTLYRRVDEMGGNMEVWRVTFETA